MTGLWTMSDFLGYASIGCWLGAQFPQVLENVKRQSCEGLALPFLANWALGDLSNLIGCILTQQLPFQTLLACYFVCVDFTLVIQYFYYKRKSLAAPRARVSRARAASATIRRMSIDRATPRSRYRTLSAVAANVAAAAAFAAQQNEPADTRYPHHHWPSGSVGQRQEASTSRLSAESVGDEPDLDAAPMSESFHSDAGSTGRKRVSWSTERHNGRRTSISRSPLLSRSAILPALQITPNTTSPLEPFPSLDRGRSLQREMDAEPDVEADTIERTRTRSRGASLRGAGMVFLATWALFGFGTLPGPKTNNLSGRRASTGKVLSAGQPLAGLVSISTPEATLVIHPTSSTSDQVVGHIRFIDVNDQPPYDLPPHNDAPPSFPSKERILGRIFAWLCATLYLTSRLPQIWKNFVRKSVEGLSMYLFIFAFLGNTFYVASILSSPKISLPPPESTEFIKESIPYILGSAGTLIFDITIVSQSLIYRPRGRHHRGRSLRNRQIDEEEAALLSADTLAHSSLGSSGLSQHGLVTSESVVQSRGHNSGARNDT